MSANDKTNPTNDRSHVRRSGLSEFGVYLQSALRDSLASLTYDEKEEAASSLGGDEYRYQANRISFVQAIGGEMKGKQGTEEMDMDSIKAYLAHVVEANRNDINFPSTLLSRAEKLALDPSISHVEAQTLVDEIKDELRAAEENSPYPEVRAVVSSVDDPEIPVGTFRAWSIGIVLVIFGTALNQFFAPRLPAIGLSITFAQLVAHPIGLLMARILPTKRFKVFGRECTLNPGPWNQKEHMMISILANVSFGGAYVTDIIAVLRVQRFYNNQTLGANIVFQLLMALSSQMIGYTLAGLTRRFLVYPSTMIWWGNLAEISVLTALHSNTNPAVPAFGKTWRITRYKVFMLCTVIYGVYFVLPDVFFQSLSFFNWTTWISPTNVKLAMITGTVTGLGITPLPTLDWNFMAVSPIITPLFSILNTYIGSLIAGCVIIPLIYFNNALFTGFLPINTNAIFDRTGSRYNISAVLNAEGVLDQAKYEAYSPVFMSAANLLIYTAFFALYTSTITHAALYHRKEIIGGFKSMFGSVFGRWRKGGKGSGDEEMYTDVHYRLMKAYPEVPEWWFLITGAIATAMAIFMIEYYKTQMPVWGLLFAFAIALFLIVPIGIMSAVASVGATLNVIAELVGGYALPGKPLGNMLFKTYGYITLAQALGYASDMKLAHYTKIPPRQLFYAQTIGTVLSAIISVVVLDWQIVNFPELCEPTEPHHFTCPGYSTFFGASVIWGAIGPYRMFTGPSAIYSFAMSGFAIGAVLPIFPWLLMKKYPKSLWRYVHVPAALSGALIFAPLNLGYYTPAIPLALFFQAYVKPRYTAFYEKYALTFAAGLGAATALFGLLYFFLFQFNGQSWSWIGNNIPFSGCDGEGCTLLNATEPFGPTVWH